MWFWLFLILAFLVLAPKPLAECFLHNVTIYCEQKYKSDSGDERDSELLTMARRFALVIDQIPFVGWMVMGVVLTPILIAGVFCGLMLRWASPLLEKYKDKT